MIRLIVKIDDANMAANVGGSTQTTYRTFDVNIPELEQFLTKPDNDYQVRILVGAEIKLSDTGQSK